ncbi:MAG: VOC family protein [Vampirovibrio sp.]|nr:VOC family protein [Vampirovibrio sp.]
MQQTAIRVTEIAFTCYPVKDMARARQFYEEVLGLTLNYTGMNGSFAEYTVGDAAFCLWQTDELNPSPSGANIAFEVEDFDGTLAALKAYGLNYVINPVETPVCHMAVVKDSEGNAINIHQRK